MVIKTSRLQEVFYNMSKCGRRGVEGMRQRQLTAYVPVKAAVNLCLIRLQKRRADMGNTALSVNLQGQERGTAGGERKDGLL